MKFRTAVFGGSFNPFARHHASIVRWLLEEADFQRVLVVPSVAHALKSDLPPFIHRYNMACLAVHALQCGIPSLPYDKPVSVSMVEVEMLRSRPMPIRTYHVLQEIHSQRPDMEIQFAIGPDIPAELHKWAFAEEIEKEFGFVHVPIQSIRATSLREMIANGVGAWKQHVCPDVVRYIERHEIYREAPK